MFQRGDRGKKVFCRSNGSKPAIKHSKCSCHLTRGPVVTSDTIQPIRGAELRKPGTDAVIITWGRWCALPRKAAQLTGERRITDIYPPLVALFPGSHFLPGCSQAIDSQCHDISLSQICWGPHSQADPCGSASTDNVTGQKRHELAHIADERRYVKNHFGCAASLSELTIHGKPHSQSARIRDFISGCQKRPQRSECVRALSFHPLTAPLQLEASFGIVVVKSITGDEFAGLFSRNIAGLFFDNHSQFHFPVHFLRAPGNHERIIWPHQR